MVHVYEVQNRRGLLDSKLLGFLLAYSSVETSFALERFTGASFSVGDAFTVGSTIPVAITNSTSDDQHS
jgi:hypothetical protein